jgi:hypothetical protein
LEEGPLRRNVSKQAKRASKEPIPQPFGAAGIPMMTSKIQFWRKGLSAASKQARKRKQGKRASKEPMQCVVLMALQFSSNQEAI